MPASKDPKIKSTAKKSPKNPAVKGSAPGETLPKGFLEQVAESLLDDLRTVKLLRGFSTNTAVIGAHAEAVVRRLVARTVHPLQVSTGTVIDENLEAGDTRQLDSILWFPLPLPALFEVGDFAVVPRSSAVAFLEIKRSAYKGASDRLKALLDPSTVVRHVADEPRAITPGMVVDPQALGVICLRESKQRRDPVLDELIDLGQCVVVLDEVAPGKIKTNPKAAIDLINFLVTARRRAIASDAGGIRLNPAALQLTRAR